HEKSALLHQKRGLKRARRGSNPQPPDRQPRRARKQTLKNKANAECRATKATTNATTAREGQSLTDDDMLLLVIEAWASLTPARRRMILTIVCGSNRDQ